MMTYSISSQTRLPQPAIVRRATLVVDELPPWLGHTYDRVTSFLRDQGSSPAGPPFAQYAMRTDGRFDVTAGLPVQTPVGGAGDLLAVTLPGGPSATTVHIGPYQDMTPGYQAVAEWVRAEGGEPVGDPWEIYYSNPASEPDPTKWRTEIVQPYRLSPR